MALALKIIIIAALLVISFGIGVAVMMFGWGLHPASWFMILGGAVVQFVLSAVISVLGKD